MTGFAHDIAGGQGDLIAESVQSPNFKLVPFTGWQITRDGHLYAADATISGTVTAGVFEGTDFEINQAGAFFYSAAPAAGNLIASIASTAGTDGFGNAYVAGLAVYGPSGGITQMAGAASNPILKMTPSGAVHVGFSPQVQGTVVNPGAVNERLEATIRSGSPSGLSADSTAIILDAAAADASTVPLIRFFVGNTAVMAAEPANITVTVPIITDSPHALGLVNSWANAGGNLPATYQLLPFGFVWIAGAISSAAATAAKFGAVPADYIPLNHQQQIGCGATGNVGANKAPFVQIDTAGNLTITGTNALPAAGVFTFSGIYSRTA